MPFMSATKNNTINSRRRANLAWLAPLLLPLLLIACIILAAPCAQATAVSGISGAAGGAASGFAYSAGISEGALQVAESTGENALFGSVTGGIFGPVFGAAVGDAVDGAAGQIVNPRTISLNVLNPEFTPGDAESATVRTNAELVQEIGTRADAWATRQGLAGTPQQLGTWEHGYAQRLLNRYQNMFGDRGLVTEQSYLNRVWKPYGTAGSVRLDVRDISTGAVWDYKFGAGGLTPAQRLRIITKGPNVTSVTEVRP